MTAPASSDGLGWLRDRPVLVTGAGGFLGARVVHRLVLRGARVRTWLGPAPAPGLQLPPAGAEIVYGDIADRDALDDALAGIDGVYHLAGPPSAAASFAAPSSYLHSHAAGTAALLERCIAHRVARLVHVSSAEVYALAAAPVTEDHPRAPRSPYGVAKLAAEQWLELCATAGGVLATIVRPFSVYGPGAPPASLIATVVAQVARGEPPEVADLRPVRDYCFVDDAADGIARAGCRSSAGVRTYNLASGRGIAVADVVRSVLQAAGRTDLAIGERTADRPPRALTLSLIGSPSRAHDELGFCATTTLDEGLARTLRASIESLERTLHAGTDSLARARTAPPGDGA